MDYSNVFMVIDEVFHPIRDTSSTKLVKTSELR